MNRNYTFRIYPTKEQEAYLDRCSDASRFVWNALIEATKEVDMCFRVFGRRQWEAAKTNGTKPTIPYKLPKPEGGTLLTGKWMSNTWTFWSGGKEWLLSDVPSGTWMHEERRLKALLRDKSKGSIGFRSRKNVHGFTCQNALNSSKVTNLKAVKVCGVQKKSARISSFWIKARGVPEIPLGTKIATQRFRKNLRTDKWYCTLSLVIPDEYSAKPAPSETCIGIDRGVTNTLATSDGQLLDMPDVRKLEKRVIWYQKCLAKKKAGSKNRIKAQRQLARASEHLANVRKNWCHEVTTKIADSYESVSLEDLAIQNMTKSAKGTIENPGKNVKRKAKLNKSILSSCWGQIDQMLKYKIEERQGVFVKVNPAYTSQICSFCDSKETIRDGKRFECKKCDIIYDADVNAARNILFRGCPEVKSKLKNTGAPPGINDCGVRKYSDAETVIGSKS